MIGVRGLVYSDETKILAGILRDCKVNMTWSRAHIMADFPSESSNFVSGQLRHEHSKSW